MVRTQCRQRFYMRGANLGPVHRTRLTCGVSAFTLRNCQVRSKHETADNLQSRQACGLRVGETRREVNLIRKETP